MKKHYINAIVSLILQGNDVDRVLAEFAKILTENGHQRMHVQVLKGVEIALEKKELLETALISVASAAEAKKLQKQIQAALHQIAEDAPSAVLVDPTLSGGFTVSYNGKYINRSYKDALLKLYRSIVNYH